MRFKTLLIIISVSIGLVISAVTAFATYVIIDVPIGWRMTVQILLTVAAMAPLVYFLSLLFSRYVSSIFSGVEERLERIGEQKYEAVPVVSSIDEVAHIQRMMNDLSSRLESVIFDLQTQNRDKEQLLLSIAHDFRTPLTVMRGYIEEIEDDLVPEGQIKPYMQILQKEISFLGDMITNIVVFLESYKEPSCKEEIILRDFLEEEVIPLLFIRPEIRIVLEMDKEEKIWFDMLSLQRVFINLFSNAIRFTSEGVIKIIVKERVILFQDSGIGIDTEKIEQIFQPFYTGDSSRNHSESGMGLGLSIVRNLLVQNGYEISVDSGYKEGAGFRMVPREEG